MNVLFVNMKVLQLTTNYPCKENPIYGIFMKEQADSLEPLGVENTIFFSNGLKSRLKVKNSGMFIHLWSALKLFVHLRRHRYDVIHCHNVHSGLILQVACGFRKGRTILSLQIDPETPGSNDNKYFEKLYKKFDALIVKKPLARQREKVTYLPNGVNTELFKPMDSRECKTKLGLDPEKHYILFVDSNTTKARTQKRRDRYDHVMEILREKYGHDNLEPLIMTKTQRADVPTWMNACDMYLLTSDEEGSPNAVKECMACNVPVVSTPVGNVPDLFEGVTSCKMSQSFDEEELAALANEVLSTPRPTDLRDSIFAKELDIDSVARRLLALYQNR